ncbi:MAG: prepilin-type N-terminal cleavage/methylation domain-containing protein [Planctomycetota bacterium]
MPRSTPPIRNHPSGFSLIEILVAIGIVSLLVAIAIPVFSLAYGTARSAQASAALAALDSAEVEYESTTGLRVWALDGSANDYDSSNGTSLAKFFQPTDWGDSSTSLDETYRGSTGSGVPTKNGHPDGYPEHYIERFIALIDQVDSTKRIWRSVDENQITDADGDGFAELTDPWGTPIVYAAFISHKDNAGEDNFLEQRGDMQTFGGGSFVPKAPAPVFVSAGPDGDFGDVNGTAAERAAAEDNLYSDAQGKGGN